MEILGVILNHGVPEVIPTLPEVSGVFSFAVK
jgi:hypothetical protein